MNETLLQKKMRKKLKFLNFLDSFNIIEFEFINIL
jgi:hypothetical protein